MRLKHRLGMVGGVLLAIGGLAFAQQPTLNSNTTADLGIAMRAKLGASQRIVEGLTSANFDLVRQGADELRGICDSRIWRHREDQIYTHYRGELHRSAIKMIEMADQQNLDGAAYTYMHTLTTCINCHQYSRDVLRLAVDPRQSGVISIPTTESSSRIR